MALGGALREDREVHSTEAIVIRLTRLTETSLIVHWLTKTEGIVKTVAKGARRSGGNFSGRLDLFFGGEISFSRAKRGELHSLREVSIHDWRSGLRTNYTSTLLAAYCCELLETAMEPEHPEPAIHDLLRRALDHLDVSAPTLRALAHFESELARMLGISVHKSQAESALRDALGRLPASRTELAERLSGP